MERKPNILLIHNYYKIPGGEDTVFKNEKEMLESRGHKVVTYTRSNAEADGYNFFKKAFLPLSAVFNCKTYRDIKKIIKREKIDVVHVHNTHMLISPAVFYAAKKMKVPAILTVHNFRLLCPAATFYRDGKICEECLKKGFKAAVKHKCYRNSKFQTAAAAFIQKFHRATGIYKKIYYICLTDFNKEKLLKHGQIREDRIFVKPNFCNGGDSVVPYNERENRFVFVGRIEEIKGVRFLLDAFRSPLLADKELVLCGSGPLDDECRKFIENNGIKNVKMLGQTSHKEVMEIVARSRALLMPTRVYEGFPMTIAEAFSVGTPVIGPDMGNVGNIIKEGINGWKYPPDDKDAFVAKLVGISDITECAKKSAEEYSEEKNYEILSAVYYKAISENFARNKKRRAE